MKSLKQLAEQIGADYIGKDQPFKGISIDTRSIKSEELFVAIKGERVNGHDFIDKAIRNKASAVMVDHPMEIEIPQMIVTDTRVALGQLAKIWRNHFQIPFIAITGSCGKTSAKEMIGSILNQTHKALVTSGNLNNDYGVPLTLGRLDESYDFAVIEAGANHLGEIAYLAEIIQPNISAITNVDAAHLEGFGSLDGVMKEKGALFDCLDEDGIAIINLDDVRIKTYAEKIKAKKITFSKYEDIADVYLLSEPSIENGYLSFDVSIQGKPVTVCLSLLGAYQANNALVAIAVAFALNIPIDQILEGLKNLNHVKGRFVPMKLSESVMLIDDTYNASVPSVKAAIESLSKFKGRCIFVMGHMGELGQDSDYYHHQMGLWLNNKSIDGVYLYGDYQLLSHTIMACPQAKYYQSKEQLLKELKQELKIEEPTWVLVKGSRATEMETVIKDLVNK
ncbi:UDP-N-acetylmuramoyl-tripeptide--D-alanyl-D-alanine ligase [Thiotrichales bacterium 19S11-10]|nr:UDP-N-acetylmuramoyl-tripeptide--D-alanyl-D-alanine ligase [Thiotrichales bacterium 19S11-10]MCF6807851.1 UDP-N-acetylmuramoyl-tripeptide--D-alanyl-D-alanine ligase [Thiotrichales bacterium 19S9-11]MCF6811865.1 UDP-N-acetylmuramoyl-tripeptide--D-alanyl-D-alanine ligase [Thiotrichales bacterium 19S9-12]